MDVEAGRPPDLHEPPLTTEVADEVYGAYVQCLDLPGQLEGFLAEDPAVAPIARCMAEHYIDSGLLRESLFSAEPDDGLSARIDAALADAAAACQ